MTEHTGELIGKRHLVHGDADPGKRGPRFRRRAAWLVVGILVCVGMYFLLRPSPQDATQQHGRGGAGGPTPVGIANVATGDLGITLEALGTVTPLANVTVRTQIAGQLMAVGFNEGQLVKKGDFLAQVDPRPYQAQLEQEQGALHRDQALLADARLDLKRYQTLVAQDSIARQQLDTQTATVHQDEGAVETDQALIDTAKLNLTYCHIVAPVTGRVGLRQVDPGNYVQTSDTNGVVILTQIDPISVIFVLPEDNIDQIVRRTRAGAVLPVTALDRSDTNVLATGTLETIDNQIDPTTGTVKFRAIFANKDSTLFPNQFVNARLLVDTLHGATLIPSAGVQRGAPGTFVYLVNPADHTVSVKVVKLGPTENDQVAILDGLKPGDQIVVDGSDKLKDGAKVILPGDPPPAAHAGKDGASGKDAGASKDGASKDGASKDGDGGNATENRTGHGARKHRSGNDGATSGTAQ